MRTKSREIENPEQEEAETTNKQHTLPSTLRSSKSILTPISTLALTLTLILTPPQQQQEEAQEDLEDLMKDSSTPALPTSLMPLNSASTLSTTMETTVLTYSRILNITARMI